MVLTGLGKELLAVLGDRSQRTVDVLAQEVSGDLPPEQILAEVNLLVEHKEIEMVPVGNTFFYRVR